MTQRTIPTYRFAVGWFTRPRVINPYNRQVPVGGVMFVTAPDESDACDMVEEAVSGLYPKSEGYEPLAIVAKMVPEEDDEEDDEDEDQQGTIINNYHITINYHDEEDGPELLDTGEWAKNLAKQIGDSLSRHRGGLQPYKETGIDND